MNVLMLKFPTYNEEVSAKNNESYKPGNAFRVIWCFGALVAKKCAMLNVPCAIKE
jgi:hypothetical protein